MAERLPPSSVLVVDDEDTDREAALRILRDGGLEPEAATSGSEACDILGQRSFDLVVTDIVMRGANGFEVVEQALRTDPHIICVTMTSFGSVESALDSLRFGAYSFATKPLNPGEFLHVVRRGLEKRRLTQELLRRNEELQGFNKELESRVAKATQELQDLNQRMLTEMASLKEVDHLKTSLLGNVTHDLRSPLTLIRGYVTYILSDRPAAEESQRCMEAVDKATSHMQYLVSQLLEAAQLDSGGVRLTKTEFPVHDLVEECAVLARDKAVHGALELKTQLPPGNGLVLRGDRGRLLQVLNNLAGNACKFTPPGGRVTISAAERGDDIHFCVEDTGPGVSPEHRERVFERFFQSDLSRHGASKGLGLGLHIAKDIVTLHGGRLWLESELGKGARFHFTIPRERAPA